MQLRTAVITSGTIPILIIFISSIVSQYIALLATQRVLETFVDELFNSQLMFVRLQTVSINFQLSYQIQKFVVMVSTINHFQSKILAGQVGLNSQYVDTNLNLELLYNNQENSTVTQLFLKDKYATSVWTQQNVSDASKLSFIGRSQLRNITFGNLLQRSFQYQSDQDVLSNPRNIQINSLTFGFNAEGMLYGNAQNTTFRYAKLANCNKGPYTIDARCLNWYKLGQNEPSIYTLPSLFTAVSQVHTLTSGICQSLRNYNLTTSKDELYLIQCAPFYLNPLSSFFNNFINQTYQSFIIEPRSQTILYKSQEQLSQQQTFYQTELQTNTNQEYALILNNTINNNYAKWIYSTQNSSNLKEMIATQTKLIIDQNYTRNDTKFVVMLNPIIIYDKLPQFVGVSSPQPKGFNTNILYVQINYITNEALKEQSTILERKINNYFLYMGIILIILFVVSVVVTILYTIKLNRLLEIPLEQLTTVLKLIHKEIKSDQLYDAYRNFQQNSSDMFLSKETTMLYQSFESIFQMLIYTTENFFSENQTSTLLRLYRNIEFFKKFKNNHAVGIIHNSIGIILMSEEHYFQALEHFSQSILYAQYEISEFLKEYKDMSQNQALHIFSFNDDFILDTESNNDQRQVKCLSSQQQINSIYSKIIIDREKEIQKVKSEYFDKSYDFHIVKQDKDTSSRKNKGMKEYPLFLKQRTNIRDGDSSTSQLCNDLQKSILDQNKELSNNSAHDRIISQNISTNSQEQLNNLYLNIYYRKKNYAITLISFQENHDNLIKTQKNPEHYHHSHNFWSEIKSLLKQLIVMTRYIDIQEHEVIELLTFISKCQLNLKRFKQSRAILNRCLSFSDNNKQNTPQNKSEKRYYGDLISPESRPKYSPQDQSKQFSKKKTLKLNSPSQIQFGQSLKLLQPISDISPFNNERLNSQYSKIYLNGGQRKLTSNSESALKTFNTKLSEKILQKERQYISGFCQRLFDWLFKDSSKKHLKNIKQTKTFNQQSLRENSLKTCCITYKGIQGLELLFEQNRRDSVQQTSNNIGDNYIQTINIALAEHYIFAKSFYEAARIITEEFENNITLYSHLPFQMIQILQDIFRESNIDTKMFQKIQLKFNKNIFQRVCFIVGEQESSEQNFLQSLNLFSDLVSQVLTKPNDEIGLIIDNKLENRPESFMELIKVKQIKSKIAFYIEDIYSILFNAIDQNQQYAQDTSETYFKDISYNRQELQNTQKPDSQSLTFQGHTQKRNKIGQNILNNMLQTSQQYHQQALTLKSDQQNIVQKDKCDLDQCLKTNLNDNYSFKEQFTDLRRFTELKVQAKQRLQNPKNNIFIPDQNTAHSFSFLKPERAVLINNEQNNELQSRQFEMNSQLPNYYLKHEPSSNQQSRNQLASDLIDSCDLEQQILNESVYTNTLIHRSSISASGSKQHRYFFQSREKENFKLDLLQNGQRQILGYFEKEEDFSNMNSISNRKTITAKQILSENKKCLNTSTQIPYKDLQQSGSLREHYSLRGTDSEESGDKQSINELHFYQVLKSAIIQFISEKYWIKLLFKKNESEKEIKGLKMYNSIEQNSQQISSQHQNYIVYTIQTLIINENLLFFQLCECLHSLDITLLIFSHQKGNNFIEQLEQATYFFKDKKLIQIFYSIQSIKAYLQSQRSTITKHIYPTYVQHF